MKLKWLEVLVLLLLIPMAVYGEATVEKELGKNVYKDSKGNKYQTTEVPLVSNYSYKKPVIDETKTLTKDEQEVIEFSLKQNGRRLVHKELKHIKNDYKNDYDRGTVEYTPKCRNYAFHKVVIPDGTVVQNSNFTQKEPDTDAISGNNLVFIDCNLVNIKMHEDWVNQGGNNCQIKRIKKSEEDLGNGKKKIIISHQVKEDKLDGKFVEIIEDEEVCSDLDNYNLAILRLNTK
jgi:hypothetical protein